MGTENLSTPQATFQLSMTMSVSLEKHVRVQWWYERYSKKVIYRRLRRIHLKIGRTVYITMLTSRRNGRTVYHWVFNTALALIPPTRDMCKPKVPGPWLLIEYIKFRGRHLESWVMFDQVFPRLTSLKQHGLVHQDRLTQLWRSFPHMVTSANRRFQARGFHARARFWEKISSCQFPL